MLVDGIIIGCTGTLATVALVVAYVAWCFWYDLTH